MKSGIENSFQEHQMQELNLSSQPMTIMTQSIFANSKSAGTRLKRWSLFRSAQESSYRFMIRLQKQGGC